MAVRTSIGQASILKASQTLKSCKAVPLAIWCLWQRCLVPARTAMRYLAVFLLLLVAVESLLSLAVYMGYRGNTYLRRVGWHRNGTLTFGEFQREVGRRRFLSSDGGGGGEDVSLTSPRSRTGGRDDLDRRKLPPCPLIPPDLQGPVVPNLSPPPSFRQLEETFAMLLPGGKYRPPDCRARQKLAVIVPYRDRRVHLKIFLRNIHPFLQKQQLSYTIFVVELAEDIKFNRALLFNVGFAEALRRDNYTCFVFHDVDLLPEDDRNLYTCADMPRHMSVAIDRLKYKLPYNQIFGGVSALSRRQFEEVNGFSNIYFGWGGEDDDMFLRIRSHGMQVTRYKGDVARYKSMGHAKAEKNPGRGKLLSQSQGRFKTDGLNSLNYTRLDLKLGTLYTWIHVTVDEKAIIENVKRDMTFKEKKSLQEKVS